MRLRYTVVVLLIAVVATPATPVTGQEDPLPAIHAKSSSEPITLSIALAVDPIRDLTPRPSLADAARANDYAAFDALYRAEPSAAFATLHELWTFSMTDPIGAFYGQATYARLARAYPGFARYIEDYRIVDSNGNVFYPTSETRAFLLDRAVEGRATPRVQVASGTPASAPAGPATSRRRTPAPVKPAPVTFAAAPAPATSVPAPVPAPVADSARVQAAARDAAGPAGEDAGAPQAVPQAATQAVPQAATQAVPQDATQAATQTQSVPATVPTVAVANNNFGTRGIFLLLVGIFGIGILALMLRTPREVPTSIMAPPVEPIKRPSAVPPPQQPQQTPPPTPQNEKNRAGGSHG